MDLNRRSIQINKITYQNRVRSSIPLVRLDFGVNHRNPDDTEVGDPHIHVYREGYGMKWAMEPPVEHFSDLKNRSQVLIDFFAFCHIVKPPRIEELLL